MSTIKEESQSSSGSEDSTSSEEEDDSGNQLTDTFEKCFFKTLSSLKSKDPSIYDSNTTFFDAPPIVTVKKKKEVPSNEGSVFVKDYERRIITDEDMEEGCSTNSKTGNNKLSYVEEQKKLKEGFKVFLNDSSDSDSDSDGLLKKHIKTEEEVQKEEDDYIQWLKGLREEIVDKETENSLKPLQKFWTDDNLDKDEEFLKDYILNKRYLDKEEPEEEDDAVSEDSEDFAEMEQFEQDYNLRYENEEASIRRYPRTIEGSLRIKDDRRKKKRREIQERKGKEKLKKVEEINRQKKVKAEEISQTLKKLKELTGNEKLAFKEQDIMGDFNPVDHDKKMAELFNNEFYSNADVSKPEVGEEVDYGFENYFEEGDEFNMDCDAVTKRESKKTRTKLKKEKKKMSFVEQMNKEKPVFDPAMHNTFDNYMEEYYKLDCEDFIGDLPCRFKYRTVEPNSFGLSIEEILAADDEDLNKWSSMSKVEKIRPNHVERNDSKMYSQRASNLNLKKQLLPSLFKTEDCAPDEGGSNDVPLEVETESATDTKSTPKDERNNNKHWNKVSKSKTSFRGHQQNRSDNFHDSRLSAYGINPKKFKHKKRVKRLN